MRQTRRIRINAPPEKVWELIDDSRKLPLWMPNVVSTRYADGRKAQKKVGSKFVQEMDEGGKLSSYEGEVTEYEPGKLLGLLMLPQAFAIHSVYHVEGDEDWTRLDFGCDVKGTTVKGHLMLFFSKKMLIRILDQQLGRLKLVAEGRKIDV